jgi:hypothetical protein
MSCIASQSRRQIEDRYTHYSNPDWAPIQLIAITSTVIHSRASFLHARRFRFTHRGVEAVDYACESCESLARVGLEFVVNLDQRFPSCASRESFGSSICLRFFVARN